MGKTFDAETLPDTRLKKLITLSRYENKWLLKFNISFSFVENTIDSFREAHNRGAQMVEFDIVLTKDKIPIVYHDFMFCINQEQENI